ncbi:MAG: beta-N-acetylhexosaminidase [Victivallaceae bacterium]|nr:beta-N-acetylhexosaminidase [Victivallaceae bacterium]
MLAKLVWDPATTPQELIPLLHTLAEEYPVSEHGRGLKINFRRIESGETVSRVVRSRGEVTVEYSSLNAACRGIGGAFVREVRDETTSLRTIGIMLDCSRNMVMKVEHVKLWLRKMALAGFNLLMLYTEETYEIEDEPFFGYMRGAYSIDEIREIDDYAARLGIEVVGCIQTLGHLRQFLKWNPATPYRDTPSVLLTDSDKTYKLIDKMLSFWSDALRSRRIHVGMDETHDLGLGKHRDLHGFEDQAEIFNRHLARVNEMCRKKGLDPMIWSDMFFRMASPDHGYYHPECKIPKSVVDTIPENVQLVYWDYYHSDRETYEKMLQAHRNIGFEPVMAAGIHTWGHLWWSAESDKQTNGPCIDACRKLGVKEILFTMWGDDGAYCEFDSALAGVFYAGDLAFGQRDFDRTTECFNALCASDFEAHWAAGHLTSSFRDSKDQEYYCIATQLLWDDPLFGIAFDDHKRKDPEFDLKFLDYCDELLCRIMPHLDLCGAGDLEHAVNTINLVMRKVELRGALEAAYDQGDRLALRDIAVTMIPAVTAALWEFDASFRSQWMAKAKPFGIEHIQMRNAAVAARLEETALRIREYLNEEIPSIEELDARLPHSAATGSFTGWFAHYFSPSLIQVN